jgi:glycosyltransferase involved in cell wall biosynthesis
MNFNTPNEVTSRPKNDLIPVLMLVPYFAPQTHAAMFRAHKLAKYLPKHGFKPIVVTTDINYLYNNEPHLLRELPAEVEVHRARHIEPTLRGLRMALGGQDRSFAALKASGKVGTNITKNDAKVSTRPQARYSPSAKFAQMIGNHPDRHWTWSGPAFRMASQLIKKHQISLMYTSAPPVSFLRAAIQLKERNNLAWLFDARDPLGYGRKNAAESMISFYQQREILHQAMAKADHVTGSARSYGQIFFDLYGLEENRFSFIPTGLDEDYLPVDPTPSRDSYLLHVGEVMPDQSPHSLRVLEKILATPSGKHAFKELIFVGRREINEPRVRKLTEGLPLLQSRLKFLDHRPQAEVYELIRSARACLLIPGQMRYWWTSFAKAVDYIALGVPVIAHVPPISEARNELGQAGTALFLDGDISADAARLEPWLAQSEGLKPSAHAKKYSAQSQVSEFADVLKVLCNRHGEKD